MKILRKYQNKRVRQKAVAYVAAVLCRSSIIATNVARLRPAGAAPNVATGLLNIRR